MNCTDHDMACFIPKESNAVSVDVSYNASLTSDITAFEQSLNNVYARQESSPQTISNDVGEKLAKAVLTPLHTMNAEAEALSRFAAEASVDGDSMKPSEIVSLTVKSQEFMFHSQLTANIANRTADGIQQLFRQQG